MEEHRVKAFQNGALRIFGPKEDEVPGGCKKYLMRIFIT
jgi:hypothetical protein